MLRVSRLSVSLGFASVVAAVGALGAACGGSNVGGLHPPVQPAGSVTCPPTEVRQLQDCSLAFNLDSTNISGTLSALSFVNVSGGVQTQSIRTVNDALMGYAFRRQDLCQQWNSCAIDAQSYRARSDNMEKVIDAVAGLKQRAEQAKNSNDQAQGQQALAAVTSQVTFTLEFAAEELDPVDWSKVPDKPCNLPKDQKYELGQPRIISAGDGVKTGAHLLFRVRATAPVYLYLLQRKAGALDQLFPSPGITKLGNPIQANDVVEIPPDPQSFCLDENDLGESKVFIVASLKEIDPLKDASDKINSGNVQTIEKSNPSVQAIDALPTSVEQIGEGCTRSRALVLDDDGRPAPAAATSGPTCPPKSRGLVLDSRGSNAKSPTSFVAMSDPGTGAMIVKVFPYLHVAPQGAISPPPAPGGARKRDIMIEQ